MSYYRRVQQNQSADNSREEFLRLENKGKNQNVSVSKSSASYPYRAGEPDCSYYLRTGSCGFGSNCRFNHPVYDAQDQIEEDQSEFRGWDELFPEALGMIFKDLSLEELLTVIPCVCKSWRNVVIGPYCWQEIDIKQWSKRCKTPNVDRMLRMLITRSSGSLRKLCVSDLLKDSTFSFITENASSLQALRLPASEMRDSVVEQTAKRLSTITLLDLSYCSRIGSRALEAIGKHCKLLATLFRNVMPDIILNEPMDVEANAIAATMPRLMHLEMADQNISTGGVMNILSGCPQLEFLNIRRCEVELDNGFLKEKFPKLKVVGSFATEDSDDLECNDVVDFNIYRYFDPRSSDHFDYDDYSDTDPYLLDAWY